MAASQGKKKDWDFYLNFYPDLALNGITKEHEARYHYEMHGKREGRVKNEAELRQRLKNLHQSIAEDEKRQVAPVEMHHKITILIRTSKRPEYFRRCMESVLNQTYDNYHVVVCYDDPDSLAYIEPFSSTNPVIQTFFVTTESESPYRFNLYCNDLLDRVNDGFVMFLDDDDVLAHKRVLQRINRCIKDENTVVVWKFGRPDKIVNPLPYLPDVQFGCIDTTCVCFHSMWGGFTRWTDQKGGDFRFFQSLFSMEPSPFRFVRVDAIFTRTSFENRVSNYGSKEE